MDNEFEKFIKAYQESNQKIKDVIDSERIGLFVDELIKNTDYTNFKSQLIVLVSNNLLGVISNTNLPDRLTELGIDSDTTQTMSVKIFSFVKSIQEEDTKTDSQPEETETENTPITAKPNNEAGQPYISNQPNTPESKSDQT